MEHQRCNGWLRLHPSSSKKCDFAAGGFGHSCNATTVAVAMPGQQTNKQTNTLGRCTRAGRIARTYWSENQSIPRNQAGHRVHTNRQQTPHSKDAHKFERKQPRGSPSPHVFANCAALYAVTVMGLRNEKLCASARWRSHFRSTCFACMRQCFDFDVSISIDTCLFGVERAALDGPGCWSTEPCR